MEETTDSIHFTTNVTDIIINELRNTTDRVVAADAGTKIKHYYSMVLGIGMHRIVDSIVLAVLLTMMLYLLHRIYTFIYSELTIEKTAMSHTKEAFNRAEYFYYRLDYIFSTAPYFKVMALLGCTACLVIVGGVGVFVVTFGELHPLECLWTSWTYVIDSGAHSETQTALHRTVSLLVTLGGMVIFALVIGLVSDQVSRQNFESIRISHKKHNTTVYPRTGVRWASTWTVSAEGRVEWSKPATLSSSARATNCCPPSSRSAWPTRAKGAV